MLFMMLMVVCKKTRKKTDVMRRSAKQKRRNTCNFFSVRQRKNQLIKCVGWSLRKVMNVLDQKFNLFNDSSIRDEISFHFEFVKARALKHQIEVSLGTSFCSYPSLDCFNFHLLTKRAKSNALLVVVPSSQSLLSLPLCVTELMLFFGQQNCI